MVVSACENAGAGHGERNHACSEASGTLRFSIFRTLYSPESTKFSDNRITDSFRYSTRRQCTTQCPYILRVVATFFSGTQRYGVGDAKSELAVGNETYRAGPWMNYGPTVIARSTEYRMRWRHITIRTQMRRWLQRGKLYLGLPACHAVNTIT